MNTFRHGYFGSNIKLLGDLEFGVKLATYPEEQENLAELYEFVHE